MTLTILATLACITLPSLGPLLARNQLQSAQTDFIAALRHARELAIHSGSRTIFCPTRDGHICSQETRWSHGWLLGKSRKSSDQPDRPPARIGPSYGKQVHIVSTGGRRHVLFQPDGSAGGSNITLLFCAQNKPGQTLSVVVSNVGRIRAATATNEQAAICAESSQEPASNTLATAAPDPSR